MNFKRTCKIIRKILILLNIESGIEFDIYELYVYNKNRK